MTRLLCLLIGMGAPLTAEALELDLFCNVGLGAPMNLEDQRVHYREKFSYHLGADADLRVVERWPWFYVGTGFDYLRVHASLPTPGLASSGSVTAMNFSTKLKIPWGATRITGGVGLGPYFTSLLLSDAAGTTVSDEDAVFGFMGAVGLEQGIGRHLLVGTRYKLHVVQGEEDTFLLHAIALQIGGRFHSL